MHYTCDVSCVDMSAKETQANDVPDPIWSFAKCKHTLPQELSQCYRLVIDQFHYDLVINTTIRFLDEQMRELGIV